jgi:hypothetical protein
MAESTEETGFYRILVAIETDATRYYGANAVRPACLDASNAEQLLAHVASDLNTLLPDISACSLITAGALYDQTQVLRPGYPVFKALESVAAKRGVSTFKPRLVSVGARQGKLPDEALQPLDDIPLGLLQLLPLVVQGPAGLVSELGRAMEYRFLEEGQLSPHSALWMESAFGISINHARLMTLTDLNAMLRLQLDHFGFLPLWELLDAALSGEGEEISVRGRAGQTFEWRDGQVHTCFETFDYWANEGAGRALPAARQSLAAGYAEWTRETRQFLTTLEAHGLKIQFHSPDGEALEGTFLCEKSGEEAGAHDAALTEHSFEELGTIAITAAIEGKLSHYFPLCPGGLNDVHSLLREHIPTGQGIAFPGTLLYDEKTRRLRADRMEAP